MNTELGEQARVAFEAPWSDEAEQRVLAKVLDARKSVRAAKPSAPSAARWRAAAVSVAAVALMGVAALGLRSFARPSGTVAAIGAASAGARLALPDGSEARMSQDGQVQLELASAQRVLLRQQRGSVTYRVRRNPARSFEVMAGSVRVLVRGTTFEVSMRSGSVEVSVTEGRVLVEDDRTRVELAPGEHVSLRRADADALVVPDGAVSDASALTAENAADSSVLAPEPRRAAPAPQALESVATLLDRVDAARSSGDHDGAAAVLRRLLARDLSPSQRVSASFTLARVERARGQHRAAAEALAECVARSPDGPLAEDAMAEQALAWERVGDRARAERAARQYVARWPGGAHLARLRHLAP